MSQGSNRSQRLDQHLNAILRGRLVVRALPPAKLFLEAICAQSDKTKCVEKISTHLGLEALEISLRMEVSLSFINDSLSPLLNYLEEPALKQLCGGQLLRHILQAIVEPPTLWNAVIQAHRDRALRQDSLRGFSWLLLELLSLPGEQSSTYQDVARLVTEDRSLTESTSVQVRVLGQKIKHALQALASPRSKGIERGPGGRHDNDFLDCREIAILPTADELSSSDTPFYRRAVDVAEAEKEEREATHVDNQFRLLREDMLGELRNDLQIARGLRNGYQKSKPVKGLVFFGVDCGTQGSRKKPCSVSLRCKEDLPQFSKVPTNKRKSFVKDTFKFFKHQSVACLIDQEEVVAFGVIDRNEDHLSEKPPIIDLQFLTEKAFNRALMAAKTSSSLQLVQVDTALFGYKPILLRIQEKRPLQLANDLLFIEPSQALLDQPARLIEIVENIKRNPVQNLQSLLKTPKAIKLDLSQAASLTAGLTRPVSIIQGPPGTGKSFIGALIAKVIHEVTEGPILVVCYTNHALDQFLEDLLDIGIPANDIIRLGSKSTARTDPLKLQNLRRQAHGKIGRNTWLIVKGLENDLEEYRHELAEATQAFTNSTIGRRELLNFLEFMTDDTFFEAFTIPESDDDMIQVGQKGKAINDLYLLSRWMANQDAGIFKYRIPPGTERIWGMKKDARQSNLAFWERSLLEEKVTGLYSAVRRFNNCVEEIHDMLNEKDAELIRRKRIVGCTTTGAAMYVRELQAFSPEVVLVEEAGEILESHVLTAMGESTKQLILIGDHKQLRPKVNNYALTVEKGDGYDLNRSLFERLVLGGTPHNTLSTQYRMCAKISSIPRRMTYPDLVDANETLTRPRLRGFRDELIFFDHNHLEKEESRVSDRGDEGAKTSKRNQFEADMVLKCVRYLGQQGYGTDKIVILTPYLGQLRLLQDILKHDHDPVLSDLDSYDLVRAGLLSEASAKLSNKPIRMSTIDNYQGEESDIVIVSMTRANAVGDIGFMAAPERLNVLITRARNALIMIGNCKTFLNSRKGKEVWRQFFEILKEDGHIYDGLPVKCERHPEKMALLSHVEDFERECPDGGCSEKCGTLLNCGIHQCPSRCHQLADHSQMRCEHMMETRCPVGHKILCKCFKYPQQCSKCKAEQLAHEKKLERDRKLELDRQEKQNDYARQMAKLDEEIETKRQVLRDRAVAEERDFAIRQKKKDLESIQISMGRGILNTDNPVTSPQTTPNASNNPPTREAQAKKEDVRKDKVASTTEFDASKTTSKPKTQPLSLAQEQWKRQKEFDNAQNDALDSLMGMIGLEDVKQRFLDIKAKVDLVFRQNTNLKDERFGAALLGNPGTGKTTVARLYAKFLSSFGVLPGDAFVETTGSKLANEGITGAKKHIESILNAGGGALFLDEAYQLVASHNYGGASVLDFLLAEMENQTGKIVFILAGYNKQMEAFFAHNPGLASRIPNSLQFADYKDEELRQMVAQKIVKRYGGKMKVEDGFSGLYIRVLSRRIGRGRGTDGFGNARAAENARSMVAERQAKRIGKERRAGLLPDDFIFTKEDIIGPEPSKAIDNNEAWKGLQEMIGLKAVKEAVRALIDQLQTNYQRELQEKPPIECSLNRVFLGSPGTGKTTIGVLYGQILADIGLLSSGEVIVKNPADFVGSVLGQSEANTKAILASTVGKVLIIDEAYMLYSGSGSVAGQSDPYKSAVVDTIVAEVQSVAGDDRCVLLIGYRDQMEEMFQNVNPGLSRRFPLASAFEFEDFNSAELEQILEMKLKKQSFSASKAAKKIALEVLERARNRPNFGNAGEVDILLDKAKMTHQRRLSSRATKNLDELEAEDFDEDFDRGKKAITNCRKLFEGVVGCEGVVSKLEGYQRIAQSMRDRGMDPREQIPFNFLFKGPPGTGKSTTIRKLGKVFYDMGFLANATVEECSASDLIGQYEGQTGPKVTKLLDKALGRVLFIDEAYRLGDGQFGIEAVNELVDSLTKPRYANKLITVLAGYNADIDKLMSINPGLTSRFPESILFENLSSEHALQLLKLRLGKKGFEPIALDRAFHDKRDELLIRLDKLSHLPNWGNGRDVETLAKNVFALVLQEAASSDSKLIVDAFKILQAMDAMISEREARNANANSNNHFRDQFKDLPTMRLEQDPPKQHSISQTTTSSAPEAEHHPPLPQETQGESSPPMQTRDPGVSDSTWQILLRDKATAERHAHELEVEMQRQTESMLAAEAAIKEEAAKAEKLKADLEKAERERAGREALEELKRRQEAARLAHLRALAIQRQAKAAFKAAQEAKRKEAEAQRKLRAIGVCIAGYKWIKQASGYSCSAGGHFVSDAQLGMS